MPNQPLDLVGLEQTGDAAGKLPYDTRATLLHRLDVHLDATGLDAVFLELMPGTMIQLGRFKQRLGRDTARVEAGAAECVLAILVLPLVDAGNCLAMLRCANGCDIARGAGTNNNYVETSAHVNLLPVTGCLLRPATAGGTGLQAVP